MSIPLQRLLPQAIPFLHRVWGDYLRTHRVFRKKKTTGYSAYTVITAVYNAEPYLEDYFRSLENQMLDFDRNIRLILIDDGSTDGSAAIMERQRRKHPRNIACLHTENRGQGAARNLGLPLVETPWVTFIDADDFVDCAYFLAVDDFLQAHAGKGRQGDETKLISCDRIFYYEQSRRFFDKHLLRGQFPDPETIVPWNAKDDLMLVSAATSFFSSAELQRQGLAFDERRWPRFEDGHFLLRYLMSLESGDLAFLAAPKYYYRKRADNSSSIDTSKEKKAYYLDILQEGFLELTALAEERYGHVPRFVQRNILYSMGSRLRDLLDSPRPAALTEEENARFLDLCRRFFAAIDPETLLDFPEPWIMLSDAQKRELLYFFKRIAPSPPRAYVQEYDRVLGELCLVHYCPAPPSEELLVDGAPQAPFLTKSSQTSFSGEPLLLHRQLWLRPPAKASTVSLLLDGIPADILLGDDVFQGAIPLTAIEAHFAPRRPAPSPENPYADSWLFMDRFNQADDNAEHLYRHVRRALPDQPIYFALRADSHDWPRLKQEGFALLDFGSREHAKALGACAKLISSHIDEYVTDALPNLLDNKRYVFLQHGVTKDNISRWLNKKHIDLMIAATRPEYDYITEDGSPFTLTARNLALTGFPRHDALLAPSSIEREKLVLVMPTWRSWLAGRYKKKTRGERFRNPEFMRSNYALRWLEFLQSRRLQGLLDAAGYRLVFFTHASVQPYVEAFRRASLFPIMTHQDAPIQDLFKRAALLITDFSSAAFEMAVLRKGALHYQFDRDEVFSGKHLTLPGYFDYARDGFGPIAEELDDLLDKLDALLARDCLPDPLYQSRIDKAITFRDGKNCERVCEAILALEKKA